MSHTQAIKNQGDKNYEILRQQMEQQANTLKNIQATASEQAQKIEEQGRTIEQQGRIIEQQGQEIEELRREVNSLMEMAVPSSVVVVQRGDYARRWRGFFLRGRGYRMG
ncbi:hypothetical protein TrLO_g7557 [Triparma laevis f. longispina]|uniref:Uncharacterized protein n=1 Tax=Triparma laevis f. longispina TaxID=1714387 RepID=A0A9W6ZXS2_9STRA|nr:hypothetical protein TrLO_g7557 [Triparma laevis f. longispina]